MAFSSRRYLMPREIPSAQLEDLLGEHQVWLKSEGQKGVQADLSGVIMNGKNLSGIDLRNANLEDARLSWIDLSESNLSGANLSGATLNHANLNRATLIRTCMRDCKLRHANLTDAELLEADLSSADLADAVLSGTALSQAVFAEDLGQTLDVLRHTKLGLVHCSRFVWAGVTKGATRFLSRNLTKPQPWMGGLNPMQATTGFLYAPLAAVAAQRTQDPSKK